MKVLGVMEVGRKGVLKHAIVPRTLPCNPCRNELSAFDTMIGIIARPYGFGSPF